jgi:hypothetical protein
MPNPHPENLVPPEPGNIRALRHGVYSPALVDLKADELRPIVTDAAPWTASPEFAGTLELYIRTLATALLGLQHIERVVAEKGYGKVPPRLIDTVNAMTNTAMRAGTLLGLDPRAKATILSLEASTESSLASLDRLSETGRAIRQRRQQSAFRPRRARPSLNAA